jgi:hypothetical protein
MLAGMGFPRERVRAVLLRCGNDIDQAANELLLAGDEG